MPKPTVGLPYTKKPNKVFLTGSTGFLGAFLLKVTKVNISFSTTFVGDAAIAPPDLLPCKSCRSSPGDAKNSKFSFFFQAVARRVSNLHCSGTVPL